MSIEATLTPRQINDRWLASIEQAEREDRDLTFAEILPKWRADVESGDDRVGTNRYYMGIMLAEVDRQTADRAAVIAYCRSMAHPGVNPGSHECALKVLALTGESK